MSRLVPADGLVGPLKNLIVHPLHVDLEQPARGQIVTVQGDHRNQVTDLPAERDRSRNCPGGTDRWRESVRFRRPLQARSHRSGR